MRRQTERKWRKECWKVQVAFVLTTGSHLHQRSLETAAVEVPLYAQWDVVRTSCVRDIEVELAEMLTSATVG